MAQETKWVTVYRVALVREGAIPCDEHRIRNSGTVSRLLQTYLPDADREHFVVILLDQKHGIIGINTVSIGSLTASIVNPREVFKPAILANAAALICSHNHPSSDPTPSREDRALTTRLVEAGKLLSIPVVDHLILGDGTTAYFSFADQGLL